MTQLELFDFKLEYLFDTDAIADLDRRVCLLLSTPAGSIPLDRDFGLDMTFLDKPVEVAKSLYTAEVTKKVSIYIKEIKVQEVKWTHKQDGKLTPKVVFTNA